MGPSTSKGIQPFVFEGARVDAVERDVEEWPDEDAFGNPGRTTVEVDTAYGDDNVGYGHASPFFVIVRG